MIGGIFSTSIVIFATSLLLRSECVKHSKYFTPDTYLSTPQIIRRHGYAAETHIIKSADGYLLEYHRIPRGNNAKVGTREYPILVHHGVLSSSVDWVTTGPGTSLPYALADNGFDVWLGNSRGNLFAKGHVEYSLSDRDFWNFSFHEMGFYDIPAAIDHILEVTSAQKVIYIGHSMGTTIFFVFATTRPEYNDKILFQISLAPVAAIPHSTSLLAAFIPYAKMINKVANFLQHGSFLQPTKYAYSFCKKFTNLCQRIVFGICGVNKEQANVSLMPLIASSGPGGTSTKTAMHLAQLVKTGKFRHYDYGKVENLRRYKAETPPPYKISDIKIPIAFFYGKNDILANPKDVKKLYQQLSQPMGLNLVKHEKWNHTDFLWAIEVEKYFIDPLLDLVMNAATDHSFIKQSVDAALTERAERTAAGWFADNSVISSKETRDERSSSNTTRERRMRRWLVKKIKALLMRHNKENNEQNPVNEVV